MLYQKEYHRRIASAMNYCDQTNVDPLAHLVDSQRNFNSATSRAELVECFGDMVFAALRKSNKQLLQTGEHPITIDEVLTAQFEKLGVSKRKK